MKLELCWQRYEAPSCYVEYDGSIWFFWQSDNGVKVPDGQEVVLSGHCAETLILWLSRIVAIEELVWPTPEMDIVRKDISTQIFEAGDYDGIIGQSYISVGLAEDPSGECWACIEIRDQDEGRSVYFDADEAKWLLAFLESELRWTALAESHRKATPSPQ